ncbi:transporter substrate-binding domain-containing protein [Shewanella sp. SHSM-M6]|uniref:Transporter substrate-binding domain-containing protein n=2 Tax=Shewanella salipaludis TaxID=2723052 RepID=A0A972JKS1_9GAMM|nr:transporter substrate-binding domain-containing protein [Shewanella salipaludis]
MRLMTLILVTLILVTQLAWAVPPDQGLRFATSNTIEPYFFADKPGGIQYDLLAAALKLKQRHIESLVLAPNRRALRLVETQKADCLINAPDGLERLHYTQSLIEYQNSLFSLSADHLAIHKVEDLQFIPLVGFQNASQYLGEDFARMAAKNPEYLEVNNQQHQLSMLFKHHAKAIVLERRIFAHYRHLLAGKLDTAQPVTETSLFAPAPRPIACRSQAIATVLDEGISLLKASGAYDEILKNQ